MPKDAPQQDRPDDDPASIGSDEYYVFKLYITGTTPTSSRALVNIRGLCEEYLPGRYELEVVDISADPRSAKADQVIAAPTLIKRLPAPLRRFIGDMSNRDRLLVGLDLRPAE